MGAEAVRGGVDAPQHFPRGARIARPDGESVDAVAVAEEPLEMIEMQPHAILAARDLGRVGATFDDGGDDDAVTRQPRLRSDDDAIPDAKSSVGGEARVYGDGTWRVLAGATRDRARPVLGREYLQRQQEERKSEVRSHGVAE